VKRTLKRVNSTSNVTDGLSSLISIDPNQPAPVRAPAIKKRTAVEITLRRAKPDNRTAISKVTVKIRTMVIKTIS
jgi:hypothetical protein